MTDHAAEAQRLLAEAQTKINPAGRTDEVTALATLAIAHTLQAIHQTLTTQPAPTPRSPRCGAVNVAAQRRHNSPDRSEFRCILTPTHSGPHHDMDGENW
jgi:hypothetical protein